MNAYTIGSLVAFALFGMGLTAAILGMINYIENKQSQAGKLMKNVCWCVFFWDFGYAWMSLCYDSDIAYVARAIALLAITFYMISILQYVGVVTEYPQRRLRPFLWIFALVSLAAWWEIIQKNAVEFARTPWGYWYSSSISNARFVQFGSILAALLQYYIVLYVARKKMTLKRERSVLRQFTSFGIILFSGYVLDTLCPMVFHTYAIPGSSVSAFVSAMVLFSISRNNKMFGLNTVNVTEYVFRDVTLPVIITDNLGKIVLYNEVAKDYLNSDDAHLLQNTMESFFEMEDSAFAAVKNTEKQCRLDKTEVKDQYDDLRYAIYFVQDITEARKNYTLMRESQRIAEQANKAKSDFLANMSHEIRTPINAVLGMDEMILRESNQSEILDYAGNIKHAGNMLLSLINDILDFSKIESGKMDIIPVEYEVSSMIQDLYMMNVKRAEKKGLQLDLKIDSTIPNKLGGDDVRIRQIITNLLTNAIKYTHEGSVTFAISTVEKKRDEISLLIKVKDTGIGIREEDQKHLFEAFKRVDESVNRNIEGTGLGLSITISLLHLMQSELLLKSAYGQGSEFYFILTQKIVDETPIGDISNRTMNTAQKVEVYQESFKAPGANILVVDDNEMNLKVVQGLLKNTGMNIDTALSGMESIQMVQQKKYDVIFMDHMMPEMDGIETVKRMKDLIDYPSVHAPIIALTANAVAGAKEMFLNSGFDDFVAKPVVGKKLEQVLLKYLPAKYVASNAKELPYASERINVKEGLRYCANDEEFYRDILRMFVKENVVDELNAAYESKNWADYRIRVDALIGMAKNIGAGIFATKARQMEVAAKDEDLFTLQSQHAEFIKEYRELLREVQ